MRKPAATHRRGTLLLAALLLPAVVVPARGQEIQTATSEVGYIDGAIPLTQFRLRYDSAYDDNRPDRAEFFYPQYRQQTITGLPGSPIYVNTPPSGRASGSGGPGPSPGGGGNVSQPGDLIGNPKAQGLPSPETRINYQDVSGYLEWAVCNRFSFFAEVPYRFLNPQVNANTSGLSDMNAGFKWAFWYCPDRMATFQLRTYIPTGDSTRGLGTDHVSLEPALLFYWRITDRLKFEGEFRDWIPIGGTDFEGNVIRYGLGFSYRVYEHNQFRVSPVIETVGWTVLNGKETDAVGGNVFAIQEAGGDTIVNVKAGVRFRFLENHTFYIGYGRALTGDVWYKDIIRAEYRLSF